MNCRMLGQVAGQTITVIKSKMLASMVSTKFLLFCPFKKKMAAIIIQFSRILPCIYLSLYTAIRPRGYSSQVALRD